MNVQAFRGVAPAQAFQQHPVGDSLAEGIGSSYGIVGYRGKVWSLRYRGETYHFTRQDDGSPLAFLDVIIVRSANQKSKSYYPAGSFDQNTSGGERPLCASINGITPDDDVVQKQCNACAVCPRNEFKVNAEGRKTRECADFKRLAVLILPTLTTPLLGAPLMDPVFLRVPAASLNDLAVFGEAMQKQGWSYHSFITRIGFMPDKAHPQMTFRAIQPLTDGEAPVVFEARDSDMAKRITGEDQVGKVTGAVSGPVTTGFIQQTAQQPVVQANPQVVQQPTTVQQAPVVQQPVQQAPVQTGFTVAGQTHQPVQQAPQQPAQPEQVQTGFTTGFVQAAPQQPQQPVVAQPMANPSVMDPTADTGAPTESDADLDARIANLLTPK